jgi:hypothetical protein
MDKIKLFNLYSEFLSQHKEEISKLFWEEITKDFVDFNNVKFGDKLNEIKKRD